MNIKNTFENWVFKARYVFYVDRKHVNLNACPVKPDNVKVEFFDFNTHTKNDLYNNLRQIIPSNEYFLNRYTNRYDNNEHWDVIFLYYDNVPVGCYWILNIPHDNFIFDSFVHDSSQILVGTSYVVYKHRGKGFKKFMIKKAMEYIFENYKDKTPVSIVEKTNKSSAKSNFSMGFKIYGMNYLIKFLKRNIISIFITRGKTRKIWLVPRYTQKLY